VEVRAETHEGLREEVLLEFQARIDAHPLIANSVYTTKDEALAQFIEKRIAEGQTDITPLYTANPFPAFFAVELVDPKRSVEVAEFLRAETGVVMNVLGQQTGIDRLVELTSQLRNLGVIVLAFVGLTVLLIVVNSIRMALMSRAQEIEIMRLVGASDRYVRWPFILEGVLIGLTGAILTLALLLIASPPISDLATDIAGAVPLGFDRSLTLQIVAIVMGAGLGLGGVGAWISVRAYLRH
jgi:cell division transport system permease protein